MFSNFKLNTKIISKIIIIIITILLIMFFSFSIYKLFFSKEDDAIYNDILLIKDKINSNNVFEITSENYATVLQTVTDNLNSYVGLKVHFSGYIYRLIDFKENEFVLARNMKINPNTPQTLVIGFLCNYDKANEFEDNAWVDVTGTIVKGDYHGEIAVLNVSNIFKIDVPNSQIVSPPDNTYIPTTNMF